MRLSSLSLAAILLFSFPIAAQHSSGGGSGGSSSSSGSSSSGGSHSSSTSSGGSSYSGSSSGNHSSGGVHNSGGVVSHSSNVHTTSSGHSGLKQPERNYRFAIVAPTMHDPASRTQPEKRPFFSFLRHPFHRAQPKPVADLRRPVCFRGPCLACPAGTASAAGGCTSLGFVRRARDVCSSWEVWSGGACLAHTHFLSDCDSLRRALQQQERRMQSGDAAQRNACSGGETQECSAARDMWRSEQSFYQSLQMRYRQCQQQSVSYFPYRFGGTFFSTYESGLFLDPMLINLNY